MSTETTSTETYEYDGEGRQTSRTYRDDGKTQTEHYEYDDQGRMTKKIVVTVDD